ncbi:hypothetical protein [Nonomuraea sp. NPDC049480]|uniref:hypothetical protein n=1 Tax=Nonomuraea sp. NPDC049480 TaxID=3364353 RepID=UPI0037B710A4
MERPPLSMEELVDHWTMLSGEAELVNAKQESMRLAFAPLLKYCTQHGRFPRSRDGGRRPQAAGARRAPA